MPEDPELMSVVTRLCTYLRAHPRSADTADGAARWWLRGGPAAPGEKVHAALRWLEALGVVQASRAADGRVRFRLQTGVPDMDARLASLAARPCGDGLPPPRAGGGA